MRATAAALAQFAPAVRAAKVETGECEILGEIGDPFWGGTDAKAVRQMLKPLAKQPVLVWLNSPGGDAFEGIAIYNVLREHEGKVTINVLGLAASAASVVAMAGDRIRMGTGAQMMIHSAWGVVGGNQADMREFAEFLDGVDESVAELYAARTGLKKAEVIEMMKKETWLTADAAIAKGFADSKFDDDKLVKAHASTAKKPVQMMNRAAPAASGESRHRVVHLGDKTPGASG